MLQETYTVKQATRAIERYCAYQERCHQEVSKKLQSMGMISIARDEIIAHLIQHNFLNETRFAQSYARGKFRNKSWGKNRIVRELKLRAISERNINLALKEIDPVEYDEVFISLSRKRNEYLHKEKDKYRKRKKLADYLLYRGWEGDLVYDRVKELIP